ncbi:Peptidoglycan O-acetyltransferase [Novipirellula aureliae]|uniref:Peptidoglycan O-acetyltransferase n=1 Tax=Novipirellula aureliae TaxID=2527966 RepID=A0A5C6DGK5_9BACT|nr:MBOAT family protein [Novipirellula aureliae]TWU35808.1 Peptidoglycan O-acetyltransferase [Novipirellula aureliae]
MQFSQLEFLIFFAIVFVAVWSTKQLAIRNGLLLVASYYFYAYWDYRFCGLLLLSTLVDFFVAKKIDAAEERSTRLRWLWVSVSVNLGVLGTFKYFNFFIDSIAPLLESVGWGAQTLNVILPVGISFYTFQTLSYTIDVYRQKLKPTEKLLNFALYVAFFPQLVAGPIVRARELLPQLASVPRWSYRRCYGGFQLFLIGAVKKLLLADRLGEMVDVVFADPQYYAGTTVWVAAFAYAGQIYYDFSGYTDMAIGVAKILGYRFPKNFRHPYLAISFADFWHRWHMTLSRWLRDYLYISLGGSRGSTWMTYRNLMLTMVLGGLWHGAAWTFVLWGAVHGVALCMERALLARTSLAIPIFFRWLMTMTVVLFAWVVFRSPDMATCQLMLSQMLFLPPGIPWYPPLVIGVLTCMAAEHLAWRTKLRPAMRLRADTWYSPPITVVLLWSLVIYSPVGFKPFVYFQF